MPLRPGSARKRPEQVQQLLPRRSAYGNIDHRRSHAGTNADSLEQRQHSRSGIDPINRTEKIHLADVDTIVAEDGVRYRNVEVDVRDCHLQEVVLSAEVLAGRP